MADSADVVVASHRLRPIPADGVVALYQSQGWWPERTPEQVSAALSGAVAVAAWHAGSLVGFACAVTDGVLRACVEDVIVRHRLRGAGMGRAMLECLLADLRPVPVVTLFCSADVVPFYGTFGFRPTRQIVLHRS